MKTCIFLGPSGSQIRQFVPKSMTVFAPARAGDIFKAAEIGFTRILLVDADFGVQASPWHKEILVVLSKGCAVLGGASMGALRAAELEAFGMVGIGRIFEDFRDGRFVDDDFVAVAYSPSRIKFQPISDAMVNIVYALEKMERVLGCGDDRIKYAYDWYAGKYFASRRLEDFPPVFDERLRELLRASYKDIKAEDVLRAIKAAEGGYEALSKPQRPFHAGARWGRIAKAEASARLKLQTW